VLGVFGGVGVLSGFIASKRSLKNVLKK